MMPKLLTIVIVVETVALLTSVPLTHVLNLQNLLPNSFNPLSCIQNVPACNGA